MNFHDLDKYTEKEKEIILNEIFEKSNCYKNVNKSLNEN